MTLTKADIVDAVAEQNGYTKERSLRIVETLLEIIKSTLESGQDVLVSRFGKFALTKRRNVWFGILQAGEAMMLAARKVVTFKCSQKLRDKINS